MSDTVILTDGIPLTQSDGVTGRNNAHEIRKGLLASILLADVKSNPLAVRNGVFPHDWDSNGIKSLRVDQTPTASSSVTINPGAFVCERTGQGPYIGWGETSSGYTLTPNASDPSNPRYDVIYAQVLDKAYISTDSQTNTIVSTLYGTASATPAVPTGLPDGAIALANLYRPAASTTITSANITDVRRGTGLVGSVRYMMPGDAATAPGKVDGELRYRKGTGSVPSLVDYWDASQGLWRGTQPLMVQGTMPGTPDSNQIVSGSVAASTDILSITVPDPGWPYRLMGMCTFFNTNSPAGTLNYYIKAGDGTLISSIRTTSTNEWIILIPNSNKTFTGTQVVKLHADTISGSGGGWNVDVRNLVTIQINPA